MFGKELFGFLTQLKKNNKRPWFLKNKERYEETVLGPALAFVEEMEPKLKRISIQLLAVAKKSGGSVVRHTSPSGKEL